MGVPAMEGSGFYLVPLFGTGQDTWMRWEKACSRPNQGTNIAFSNVTTSKDLENPGFLHALITLPLLEVPPWLSAPAILARVANASLLTSSVSRQI